MLRRMIELGNSRSERTVGAWWEADCGRPTPGPRVWCRLYWVGEAIRDSTQNPRLPSSSHWTNSDQGKELLYLLIVAGHTLPD